MLLQPAAEFKTMLSQSALKYLRSVSKWHSPKSESRTGNIPLAPSSQYSTTCPRVVEKGFAPAGPLVPSRDTMRTQSPPELPRTFHIPDREAWNAIIQLCALVNVDCEAFIWQGERRTLRRRMLVNRLRPLLLYRPSISSSCNCPWLVLG